MAEADDSPNFGQWLKARRRALDLTQDALAARAGCAGETLRKIEAGVLRPSRQLAAIIAGHKCGGDGYILVRVGCGAGRNPGVLCCREGRFHHFVEIDLDGNLIRAV